MVRCTSIMAAMSASGTVRTQMSFPVAGSVMTAPLQLICALRRPAVRAMSRTFDRVRPVASTTGTPASSSAPIARDVRAETR